MKITADNSSKSIFDIQVILTPEEESDISETFFSFSVGLARLIQEFVHLYDVNEKDAPELMSTITETVKALNEEYFDSGTFSDVKRVREERRIYSYMQKIFDTYLKENGLTENDLLIMFAGFETIAFNVSIDNESIVIKLADIDGRSIQMESVPINVFEDENELEHMVGKLYIVAVLIGDTLFGEEDNPIRKLRHTEGYVDGGLVHLINKALN